MGLSDQYLEQTLNDLGFSPDEWESSGSEVIHDAPAEVASMAETYQKVNDHLERLIARAGSLQIRHVTGEARALLDPAHRRVLRRAAAGADAGRLLCSFEYSGTPTAVQFVSQQHIHWDYASWVDIIDLLTLAATENVYLRVLPDPEPIHFSVFEKQYVLLQDRHHHPTQEKRVWFLRSHALADHLMPRIVRLWDASTPIPAITFGDALNQLHDFETVAVASAIQRGERPSVPYCYGCEESRVSSAVELLTAFGFAVPANGSLTLTPQAEAWLSTII